MSAEVKLSELGLELPSAPKPTGLYKTGAGLWQHGVRFGPWAVNCPTGHSVQVGWVTNWTIEGGTMLRVKLDWLSWPRFVQNLATSIEFVG